MSASVSFRAFPKIPRLNREVVVTEKNDGTNGAVVIARAEDTDVLHRGGIAVGEYGVLAQSRTRFIYPDSDNFGFAAWVAANADALVETLGEGAHYGEWYGKGIQRNYGLPDRRFMLFNAERWAGHELPPNVEVATEIYRGNFNTYMVERAVDDLRDNGSRHVEGFPNPEGVVVWHGAARQTFKVLCENDDIPKMQGVEHDYHGH